MDRKTQQQIEEAKITAQKQMEHIQRLIMEAEGQPCPSPQPPCPYSPTRLAPPQRVYEQGPTFQGDLMQTDGRRADPLSCSHQNWDQPQPQRHLGGQIHPALPRGVRRQSLSLGDEDAMREEKEFQAQCSHVNGPFNSNSDAPAVDWPQDFPGVEGPLPPPWLPFEAVEEFDPYYQRPNPVQIAPPPSSSPARRSPGTSSPRKQDPCDRSPPPQQCTPSPPPSTRYEDVQDFDPCYQSRSPAQVPQQQNAQGPCKPCPPPRGSPTAGPSNSCPKNTQSPSSSPARPTPGTAPSQQCPPRPQPITCNTQSPSSSPARPTPGTAPSQQCPPRPQPITCPQDYFKSVKSKYMTSQESPSSSPPPCPRSPGSPSPPPDRCPTSPPYCPPAGPRSPRSPSPLPDCCPYMESPPSSPEAGPRSPRSPSPFPDHCPYVESPPSSPEASPRSPRSPSPFPDHCPYVESPPSSAPSSPRTGSPSPLPDRCPYVESPPSRTPSPQPTRCATAGDGGSPKSSKSPGRSACPRAAKGGESQRAPSDRSACPQRNVTTPQSSPVMSAAPPCPLQSTTPPPQLDPASPQEYFRSMRQHYNVGEQGPCPLSPPPAIDWSQAGRDTTNPAHGYLECPPYYPEYNEQISPVQEGHFVDELVESNDQDEYCRRAGLQPVFKYDVLPEHRSYRTPWENVPWIPRQRLRRSPRTAQPVEEDEFLEYLETDCQRDQYQYRMEEPQSPDLSSSLGSSCPSPRGASPQAQQTSRQARTSPQAQTSDRELASNVADIIQQTRARLDAAMRNAYGESLDEARGGGGGSSPC